MAVSPGSIRVLKGHVEIGGDLSPLQGILAQAKAKLNAWGNSLAAAGRGMLQTGIALAAPLGAGVMQFASYEQALADLRAASNPTAEQFARVKKQIEEVALATGTMPAEVANAYSELLKAGVPLEKLLNGLGETTIKFARVSGMSMSQTAIILSDSMNAFAKDNISASAAANIMNQAADASTISLSEVAMSFARGGSVAAMFGQNMQDVATAIAIMGNKGIKGSMAGDALKTLLTRLATGAGEAGEATDEASKAIQEMGLTVRDSSGKMLPLLDIIQNIEKSLSGRSQADKDRLMKSLGGMRGLLSLTALMSGGSAAFLAMRETMQSALPVEAKFEIMTNTLTGAFKRFMVQLSFVGIAVGEILAPALRVAGDLFEPILTAVRLFVSENKSLVQMAAGVAAGLLVVGGVLWIFGTAITAIIGTVGALFVALKFGLVMAGLAAIGYGLYWVASLVPGIIGYFGEMFTAIGAGFQEIGRIFGVAWGGIKDALTAGDLSLAFEIAWTALQLVFAKGVNWLADIWGVFTHGMQTAFVEVVNFLSGAMIGITRLFISGVAVMLDGIIAVINTVIDALPAWATDAAGIGRIEFNAGAAADQAMNDLAAAARLEGPGELQPVDRSDEAALERRMRDLSRQAATRAENEAFLRDPSVWFRQERDRLLAELQSMPGPDMALDQQLEDLVGNAAFMGVDLSAPGGGNRPRLPTAGALAVAGGGGGDLAGSSHGGFLARSITGYAAISAQERVARAAERQVEQNDEQLELMRNAPPQGLQVV